MGPGYLLSEGAGQGEEVYQYFGAWPHSHGDTDAQGRANTAIVRYTSRRDGWVSASGDYAGLGGFGNATAGQPSLTTVPLAVPRCGAGQAAALRLNILSSVVGYVAVELRCGEAACPGYDLGRSSRLRGNFIAKPAGWGDPAIGGDFVDTLKPLEGSAWPHSPPPSLLWDECRDRVRVRAEEVSVHLVMPDAEVFSLTLLCA